MSRATVDRSRRSLKRRLRDLMARTGWTTREAARRLGISQTYVVLIAKGERKNVGGAILRLLESEENRAEVP